MVAHYTLAIPFSLKTFRQDMIRTTDSINHFAFVFVIYFDFFEGGEMFPAYSYPRQASRGLGGRGREKFTHLRS